jgi:hypothetical protein
MRHLRDTDDPVSDFVLICSLLAFGLVGLVKTLSVSSPSMAAVLGCLIAIAIGALTALRRLGAAGYPEE